MSLTQLSRTADHPPEKRKRSLAWLLPCALVLGFLLVVALLFGNKLVPAAKVNTAPVVTLRQEASSAPKPGQAPTAPTSAKGAMLFQASGWIEPDPYTTFVPTLTDGVVSEVKVLEGQRVKKGDLLATLVDDDAKLDLRQAEQKLGSHRRNIDAHCRGSEIVRAEMAAVEKKVAALEAAKAEADDHFHRLKKLPPGAVSRQQVVMARLASEKQAALAAEAKAEIPRLQARLKQIESERVAMAAETGVLETARDRAKLALDRTRITAPMDGVVLRLHAAPGKKRMQGMDDPTSAVIVELYDPRHLQARIDVPLTEAAGMQIGQIVELTSDLLPEMVFDGRVTRITGEADLQRNTLQAKVSIKKPDPRLRPEMLVRGKFFANGQSSTQAGAPADQGRLAIYVPEAALVDESHVWVVAADNTAELRTIRLGAEQKDQHRRVLDGLRSGEQVILPPHDQLQPGARVQISR